jgi:hypothetical protein
MNRTTGLFGRVAQWTRNRRTAQAEESPFPEDEVTGPRDGMTETFHRRRRIDEQLLFDENADQSLKRHRKQGRTPDPIIGELLLELWGTFFSCFREDERAFELARFQDQAADVQQQLDELPSEAIPDLVTSRRLLFLLTRFMREHFDSWDNRLDQMAAQIRELQQQNHAVELTNSWQQDETQRCRQLVADQLSRRETVIPSGRDGMPPLLSQLLCTLFDISSIPQRPQAHLRTTTAELAQAEGGESAQTPAATDLRSDTDPALSADDDTAIIRRVLRAMLRGEATPAKVTRTLEDADLAQELCRLSEENRRYRTMLSHLGLLPAEPGSQRRE